MRKNEAASCMYPKPFTWIPLHVMAMPTIGHHHSLNVGDDTEVHVQDIVPLGVKDDGTAVCKHTGGKFLKRTGRLTTSMSGATMSGLELIV